MSSGALLELPKDLKEQVRGSSTAFSTGFENRSNARVKALIEGQLSVKTSPCCLHEIKRDWANGTNAHTVIKDMSRSGIGFYFHSQLFPQEIVEIEFQNRFITAIVVRCRYLQRNCFEVGAKVLTVETKRS